MFWIGMLLGAMLGSIIGMLIISLLIVGKNGDNNCERRE